VASLEGFAARCGTLCRLTSDFRGRNSWESLTLFWTSPSNRKQTHGLGVPRTQQSSVVLPAPLKHLIGINSVRPRHPRHRSPCRQRLFDDPPFLLYRPPPSCGLSLTNRPLRSVHVSPRWTLPLCPLRASSPLTDTPSKRYSDDAYSGTYCRHLEFTDAGASVAFAEQKTCFAILVSPSNSRSMTPLYLPLPLTLRAIN
jgi:hypothetical protein